MVVDLASFRRRSEVTDTGTLCGVASGGLLGHARASL